MPKKSGAHHVMPNADGGWDVKKDGATCSSGRFDKEQAGTLTGLDQTHPVIKIEADKWHV